MIIPDDDADPDLVWHYTDAAGLLGILDTGTLRASHVDFVNDKLESHVLEHAFEEYVRSLEEPLASTVNQVFSYLQNANIGPGGRPRDNYFLACASTLGNSLTMWRNYARDRLSYAIGIDRHVHLDLAGKWLMSTLSWQEVQYIENSEGLPAEIRGAIKSLKPMDAPVNGDTMDNWLTLELLNGSETASDNLLALDRIYGKTRSIYKDRSFADEHEVRLIFRLDEQGRMPRDYFKFRTGAFGLTPYVELATRGDSSNPLPIKAVTLSPQANDADERALRILLSRRGCNDVEVHRSHMPIRW